MNYYLLRGNGDLLARQMYALRRVLSNFMCQSFNNPRLPPHILYVMLFYCQWSSYYDNKVINTDMIKIAWYVIKFNCILRWLCHNNKIAPSQLLRHPQTQICIHRLPLNQ